MINLPYYGQFLERYGFRKAKDYHAYELEVQTPVDPRLERLAERARAWRNIETRMANMKAFHQEVRLLVRIYIEA